MEFPIMNNCCKKLVRLSNRVINEPESMTIRQMYIDTYIDASTNKFKKYNDYLIPARFLWDMRKENLSFSTIHNVNVLKQVLLHVNPDVYLMWDHSLGIYGDLARNTIVDIKLKTLLNHLDILPKDLYIFDSSYEWTIMFTHEL